MYVSNIYVELLNVSFKFLVIFWIWLITIQVQICYITSYNIHPDIFVFQMRYRTLIQTRLSILCPNLATVLSRCRVSNKNIRLKQLKEFHFSYLYFDIVKYKSYKL